MDIVYDHYLAKNWRNYSDEDLEDYADNFYKLLQNNYDLLTEKTQRMKLPIFADLHLDRTVGQRNEIGIGNECEQVIVTILANGHKSQGRARIDRPPIRVKERGLIRRGKLVGSFIPQEEHSRPLFLSADSSIGRPVWMPQPVVPNTPAHQDRNVFS